MLFESLNPYDRQKAVDYLNRLLNKDCMFHIIEEKPQRSLKQNNYYHLIAGYFGAKYGVSKAEVELDFIKRKCNPDIFERRGMNSEGREVVYLRSSKDLDTREMTIAIERFRNWSAAEAGIYLPSPNEEQFLRHCKKVIEENKEFL